jgi:hypothetical protein
MEASMDPNAFALLMLQHATSGNWRALASIVVLGIVWALRNGALRPAALARFPRLAWFKTDKGGVALNFLIHGLGGVGNALFVHTQITGALLLTAAVNACISAGLFVSIKRLAGRPAAVPVAPASAVAATDPAADAAITTTTTTEQPK